MKKLIPLLLLASAQAQAIPLTIWSCTSSALTATITTEPTTPGQAPSTLTVRDRKSKEVITLARVREMGQRQLPDGVPGPIAVYQGGDTDHTVTLTVTNRVNSRNAYVSQLVWNIYGERTTRTFGCQRTRGFNPF